MSDDAIQVKLGADTADVAPKFEAAASAIKSSVASMKASMEGLQATMASVKGAFLAVTTALAGGALFKDAVKETVALTGEVTSLSKKLAISRDEASYLNVALKHIGATAEEYISITTKLDRQLRSNEDHLKSMGVVTRAANGEYANQGEVLKSALAALMTYKEGTDRNLASMDLFGRSADEATKLLKLNEAVMAEAKETAIAFGLVMGKDMQEGAMKMKVAMATIATAGEAVEVAIGRAVMPNIIAMANFIKSNATPIMEGMGAAIGLVTDIVGGFVELVAELRSVLVSVFQAIAEVVSDIFGNKMPSDFNFFAASINVTRTVVALFKATVLMAFAAIKFAIEQVTNVVTTLVEAWRALQNLDLKGAVAAIERGAAKAEEAARKHWKNLKNIAEEGQAKVEGIWNGKKEEKDPTPYTPTGTKSYTGKGKGPKTKDITTAENALAKAELEAANAILQDNLKRGEHLYEEAHTRNLISIREFYAAKTQIDQAAADNTIATKKQEIANLNASITKAGAKDNPEGDKEVLKLRTQLATLTGQLTILEAQRAEIGINNNAKMVEEERKRDEKIESINIGSREKRATAEVDTAEKIMNAKLSAGALTAKEGIQQEREFEATRNQIMATATKERLEMELGGNKDPAAIRQLNEEIEQLERTHQLKMTEINLKAAAEINKPFKGVIDTMSSSFATLTSSLVSGTVSIGAAFKSMALTVGQSIITEMIVKPLQARAVAWLQEKVFNVSGVVEHAAVAGAAATASAAAIPLIGWMLAPEAGAAAYGAAMAYAPQASAEGGFDIPAGMNPMTQLHQKEMVLPAKHADVIRDMADNGGGGGDTHLHVHAVDAHSVRRLFQDNGSALVDVLKKQNRNFAF
jgi:hypothetical protein